MEQIQETIENNNAGVEQKFADLDKDGKVDFEEFKLLVGYSPPLAAAEPEAEAEPEPSSDDCDRADPEDPAQSLPHVPVLPGGVAA